MKLQTSHRKRNKEKKSDCMETKKYDTKKPMGHWWNQEIIIIPRDKNNENKTLQKSMH